MRRSLVALALAVMLPLPMPVLAGTVTVKEGETLSEIAERHGISLSRLMQINGIRNADQVEAGRTLTLPGGSGGRSAQGGRTGGTVSVKEGETLSEIAERHGISLSRLMQINGIRNADQVEAGQTLRLAAPATARSGGSPAPSTPSYPRGASEHVVRSGESLSGIASGYGIGLSKLIAINGISDPDHVEAGTRLKLKGTPPAPTPRPAAPTPRPAVTTAAANAGNSRPAARPAAATATATTTTTTTTTAPATRPAAPAARPVATASPARPATAAAPEARPAAAASTTPTTVAMASRPDWRTYGPLQVNWAAWQPMGGSMVAPTLNGEGQTLYVAINCGARKFNSTTPAGAWQSWSDPTGDYEQQLVSDYCRTRS